MSSLPVADTSLAAGTGSVVLPHFADGGGWTTQIILVNPTDSPISGAIRLVSPTGLPLDAFSFSIPRRSSFKQLTPSTSTSLRSGSVQILPNVGNLTPVSEVIFSYKPAGVTISEAAVTPVSGTTLRMYSEASGVPGSALSRQTAVAVTNLSANPAIVTFEQTGPNGSLLATASRTIPGSGQIAEILSDLFASATLQLPLQGVLKITASEPGVSVVGLRGRYNERGEFLITTTPPANEVSPSNLISNYVLPEVANGGGYTTQFLLFGKSTGQSTNGRIVLANQDGTLPLSLNCPALQGGTGTTSPEVLRRVLPQYTDAGREARISGVVSLQGVVHEDGSLSFSRFIQTVGYGLDENSRNAIEQWRFCPATSNGRAVSTTLTITVTFSIV
jgi:TonB family protein